MLTNIKISNLLISCCLVISSATSTYSGNLKDEISIHNQGELKFVELTSMFIYEEISNKTFFQEILGKDLSQFKYTKRKTGGYEYKNNNKKELGLMTNQNIIKHLYIYTGNKKSYKVTIKLDRTNSNITPRMVKEILGEPTGVRVNIIDPFYNDCTMGYYNELLYFYKKRDKSIRYRFNLSNVLNDFLKTNNITKPGDDPKYSKLRSHLYDYKNNQNTKAIDIRIKLKREN